MIDLHCHSTFSDGSLTPEELIDAAEKIRLTALALTDHDTVAGLPRFLAAAVNRKVRAIPGIELSVDSAAGVMHMLGYWIDIENPDLLRQIEWVRNGRAMRNRAILEKLNELGMTMTEEEVRAVTGEDVVGRPHFGQVMIQKGYAKNKDEVFNRWLGTGKPAYVDRERLTAEAAVRLVVQAGGVAVLAHPFTIGLPEDELSALLADLTAIGLSGMECYYSEHSTDLTKKALALAERHNLVPTGGSDFHGDISPDIRLGVGFGGLHVPDEVLPALEARRPR